MPSVITVSSFRGGVGKSSFSLELALSLSLKGKVLLIDTDFYAPTLLREISSRSKKSLTTKGYFRDVLRGLCSVADGTVAISPTLHAIFSDPRVNLWELSLDIGSKNFWIEDNPDKPSQIEHSIANLKAFVEEHSYNYLVFDLMAGLAYPVVYFSYLSNHPVFLTRPSLPQIDDTISFINLIGMKDRPVNLIWSNVPRTRDYMEKTRFKLTNLVTEKCGDKVRPLGLIPRDAEFEYSSLRGSLTLIPGKMTSAYYTYLLAIVDKLLQL